MSPDTSPSETAIDPMRGASSGALWTLPNALTILRIFLVPLLVVVLLTRYELVGVGIFVAASFTDWLDGYLARKRRQVTTLGQLLDPIADKLLICSAFVSLVELDLAPAWMVVIIVGREIAVTGLRSVAERQRITIPASPLGKYKMGAQVITVILLILGARLVAGLQVYGRIGLWVVVLLATVSATRYFLDFWSRVGVEDATADP